MKQMFSVGELVTFHDKKYDYIVKVIAVNGEEGNDIWYEVEPWDVEPWVKGFHRAIPQSKMEEL